MKKVIEIQIPEGYDDVVFDKETNKIKFVKKDSKPRSWEEYCKQVRDTFCFAIDAEGYVTEQNRRVNPFVNEFNIEEEAKAINALCKLIQLRDAWWGDWKPDWNSSDWKFIICVESNKIRKASLCSNHCLAFPTIEMRDEFFETFRDLIEEAKSLL
jgi:hypothetical protein